MWCMCLFFLFVSVLLFIHLFVCLFVCLFVYSFILSFIRSTLMSLVSDSTALNYRMIIEQWFRRRDVKRSSHDLTWDITIWFVRRDHGNHKKTQNNKSQPRLESWTSQMQNTSTFHLLAIFIIFYVLIFIGPLLTRGTSCDSVFNFLYLIYVNNYLMTSCIFGSVHMQCLCVLHWIVIRE